MDYQRFMFSVDDAQCPDFRNTLVHQVSSDQQAIQCRSESADHPQRSQTEAYHKHPEAVLVIG